MSETLVVRLRSGNTELAEWVVVDDTGACTLAPAAGPVAGAAALSPGRRTVCLLPATRVLRTRADVPIRNQNRLAQALPFALEDLLAEDIDDLHFASGARHADGRISVAVIRRTHMDEFVARLAAAGLAPQAIYADSDGVSDLAGTTTVLLEDAQVILRDPGGDAIAAETDGLDALLALWLAQSRPADESGVSAPRNLQVYDATTEGWPNRLWEELQNQVQSLEVRRLPDGALARLAAGIAVNPGVDLLQGPYARRSSFASYWPRWRLAAALVGALGITMLLSAGVETWRLRRESAALDIELGQAIAHTFPGSNAGDVRALVDQRLQIGSPEQGLAKGRQFLDTLRTVASAVSRTGSTRIESLNYRTGIMELTLRVPNADSLDSIRKLVTEDGKLNAEIQSSNAEGEEIQGRIRISSAAGPGGA
jgi:general secretion pathway protein L